MDAETSRLTGGEYGQKKSNAFNVGIVFGILVSIAIAIAALVLAVNTKSVEEHQPAQTTNNNYYNNYYSSVTSPYSNTVVNFYAEGVVVPVTTLATVIGMDGLPVMAYGEFGGSRTVIKKCLDVACKTTKFVVVAGVDASQFSGIIGRDGLPFFAFFDLVFNPTVATLKSIHCEDIDCGNVTVSTIDSAGEVGWYPVAHIAADGNPVITYMNNANQSIKLAHCVDVACAKQAEINQLVAIGGVHSVNSQIGPDGFLFIAFTSALNGSVSLLHCVDILCTDTNLYVPAGDAPNNTVSMYTDSITGFVVLLLPDGTINACVDAACSSFAQYTIPLQNSYALTTNTLLGFPMFVTVGSSPNELDLIKCTTSVCDKYNAKTILSMPPTTQFTELQIATTGPRLFPLISFGTIEFVDGKYLIANGTLSVLYCDNPWCNPWKN